jgi:hypothetical protein
VLSLTTAGADDGSVRLILVSEARGHSVWPQARALELRAFLVLLHVVRDTARDSVREDSVLLSIGTVVSAVKPEVYGVVVVKKKVEACPIIGGGRQH